LLKTASGWHRKQHPTMTSSRFLFHRLARPLMAAILVAAAVLPCAATEIIAHRGYSAKAPENTVAAFNLAWESGADACELDLYLTKDAQIAVIHDKDTKRTTGVAKVVAESTLEELMQLDAGSWKDPKWKDEKIPALQACLATLPMGNKRFYLEIKCGPEVVPALARTLGPWKARASQLAVISFNAESAAATKKALPWMKVYLLASGKDKEKKPRTDVTPFIEQAKKDGLDGLDLGQDWPWTEAFVKQIRDAGLGVLVWTVNDPAKAKELAAMGVEGITTDDPVLIREALSKK
jgi:glycerophosphoryl diester phosphodiesterase